MARVPWNDGPPQRQPAPAGNFSREFEVETIAAAALAGVPAHTIRNWASRGYLKPVRADGARTIYNAADVARCAARFGYLPDLREDQDADCCVTRCARPSWPDVPVPLCYKHAVAIWLHVSDEFGRRLAPAADRFTLPPRQSVVYFIRAGDRVKIGMTASLPGRVDQLQVSTQEKLEILLVVPGGRAEEKQVHALFAADRVRGEWFTLSPALDAFITERSDQDIRHVHGRFVAQ